MNTVFGLQCFVFVGPWMVLAKAWPVPQVLLTMGIVHDPTLTMLSWLLQFRCMRSCRVSIINSMTPFSECPSPSGCEATTRQELQLRMSHGQNS